MAVSLTSNRSVALDDSGRLPLDEAPLRSIHIVAAAAVLGGAVLDGYLLGIVGPALRLANSELAPVLASLDLDGSLGVGLLLNIIQIVGSIFGVFMLHWMSRRGFAISTFVIILTTFLALGRFPQALTWFVVSLFAIYMFIGPASNNIEFVYLPEIFDTHLRATGIGFWAALSRVSAAGVTYLLPWLLERFGFSATLIMMAGFPLLGLVLSILWAPETKHKHLT